MLHSTPDSKSSDCLFFGSHKGVIFVGICVLLGRIGNELNIGFFSATDMGNSQLREFDASLPILLNDITSDVGITLTTFDDYAIMAARSDDVFPYFGRAELRFIGSSNFYTIFMTSFNLIFNYV